MSFEVDWRPNFEQSEIIVESRPTPELDQGYSLFLFATDNSALKVQAEKYLFGGNLTFVFLIKK